MDSYEIVMKLIGSVYPVGETNEDNRRFENLKELVKLTDRLLGEIDQIAICRDAPEHSRKRAGEYAAEFMNRIIDVV